MLLALTVYAWIQTTVFIMSVQDRQHPWYTLTPRDMAGKSSVAGHKEQAARQTGGKAGTCRE